MFFIVIYFLALFILSVKYFAHFSFYLLLTFTCCYALLIIFAWKRREFLIINIIIPYISWGKSSHRIFSLLLYSARIMLEVNSVQFSLHQGRKVKLQYFLSLALFGTCIVRGKQRTLFLTSGKEKSSYSIFFLVLYLAPIMLLVNSALFSSRVMLGVNSVQFSLHQRRKVKHWLPFKFRINFKILLFTFKAIYGHAPGYLIDLIAIKEQPRYYLRSANGLILKYPSF